MSRLTAIPFLLFLFITSSFFCLPSLSHAQKMEIIESEEFDIQFEIPTNWELEIEEDSVAAFGNGIVFVITAVKDDSITTKELFEIQVETLEMESEGEVEEVELKGGIHGMLGGGAGVIDGDVVGLVLLAATLDENNYLAYIFAEPKKFERQKDLIFNVITSLAPLGFEE
ncbi:MAG: hypothetical protein ACI8UO_005402 [Verrucomicrobiales bacterium]|jgi:hypothetical protein